MSAERLRVSLRARGAAKTQGLRSAAVKPNRSEHLQALLSAESVGKARVLRERGEQERDLAQAWWRLIPQTQLSLVDGRRCLLLYSGQPGGPAGPDVRDAVLLWLPRPSKGDGTKKERDVRGGAETETSSRLYTPLDARQARHIIATEQSNEDGGIELASMAPECRDEARLHLVSHVGDVEFHLRASDWFTHGHHTDPRYNQVILHVVLYPDSKVPTRRQDGCIVPTCSLLDSPQAPLQATGWPCQQTPLSAQRITTTLLYAGLQRFAEKSQNLRRELAELHAEGQTGTHTVEQAELWADKSEAGSQLFLQSSQLSIQGAKRPFSVYDTCLLAALAEGLGYGRDRAFFRAVGLRLVGLSTPLPEPLGHTQFPAPLDARRLRTLYTLITRWQTVGAWNTLNQELRQEERDVKATVAALRAALYPLSRARADILIVNIVLPFAVAVAELENDTHLAARAQGIFLAYPGLVSNRITRRMSTQLQLPNEPGQACLQQGLHHIYAHTCRAKACQDCLCGGQRL